MEEFSNKCRACLTENDAMLSLFDVYEHELTLATILQSCISGAQIAENDGLPSGLCDSCILVLTQFYNFTVVYEESDKQLQQLLRNSKKLVEACEVGEDLNLVEEQVGEVFESDANELATSDSKELLQHDDGGLNDVIAVAEVDNVEVQTTNCNEQDDFELLELKKESCVAHPQQINHKYEIQPAELVHEFKKEIIPLEELEHVEEGDCSNQYLELHVSDSNEAFSIKDDPDFKQEHPLYEEITKYECTICGEAHLYAASFQQHMRVKHHLSEVNCEEYASRIQIKVHHSMQSADLDYSFIPQELMDFTGDPTHQCQICDKKFHLLHQLQHHSKLHDVNKKYVCEVCGARFIRKTYLDDHMEGHSTELKHVCKFCGKAFRRRTVLRAHKRVHTHPNHYVCELCGRAFTNSSTLKTHKLLIHVRERNFNCVICGLTFPLKSTLNKHVLRHQKRENGEKGFSCVECDMQYRDKSSLKRHIETKHQGKVQVISCPDCPKKYTSKANLMKHRRRHHSYVVIENDS